MNPQKSSKPNIILLTIDTLRADWVGCYGHKRPITPNLDRLAAKGIRFEQAMTGGSWTQAAFPVMMTSTYASMYGGCLGPLSAERPSPIELLSQNGYKTAAFSTSPLLSKTYGYDRGFDQFSDLMPGEREPALRHMKGGQRLLRTPLTHHISRLLGVQTRPAKSYISAEELTTLACDWIGEAESPFLAWVHYMDVHWPYHKEDELTRPKDIAQAWEDVVHLHNVNWNGATVSAAQRAHYIELYEEAVRYTDAQVGRLLDYLDESGYGENTIVLVVADHGEEFMERGYWGHVEINLYDEILNVPMILRLPGQTEGVVVQRQVRTLDMMPTLLDLCGFVAPDGVEGVSMAPLWTNGNGSGDYVAPFNIGERWRDDSHVIAIRTEAFKYIWDSEKPDQPLLYNLQEDAAESKNVVTQYREQAAEFQAIVEAHLLRVQETMPETAVSQPELDEEVISRLRDLGYVE